VRHVALNRLRNGRRNHRRRDEILATIHPVAPDDLTDALLDLRRAVAELPERMRLAVCLHYLADLSVDDVAATLDVAPGTVKSNLHDARARLRVSMEEHP
jgi:RNA polymerase sigma-70 factor (ECF subfamily)